MNGDVGDDGRERAEASAGSVGPAESMRGALRGEREGFTRGARASPRREPAAGVV